MGNVVNLTELKKSKIVKKGTQRIKVPIKKPNGESFDGQTFLIPLEYLYYNDQNGRIGAAKSAYENENGLLNPDALEEYNKAVQEMIYQGGKADLDELVADMGRKGQEQPGYVLNDGRVVDGNRRFTAKRMLNQDERVTEIQYYEAVILDDLSLNNSKDKALIKQLELQVQFGTLGRVDYDPIDRAIDAYQTINVQVLMTATQYANFANIKKADVKKRIDEAELIIKFLEWVGADKTNYSLVKEMKLDGPLQDMLGQYNKSIKGSKDENEILGALFLKLVQLRSNMGDNDDFKKEFRPIVKEVIGGKKQNEFLKEMENSQEIIDDALMDRTDQNEEVIPVMNIDDLYTRIQNKPEAVEALVEVQNISTDITEKAITDSQKREPIKLVKTALTKVDAIDISVLSRIMGENKKL